MALFFLLAGLGLFGLFALWVLPHAVRSYRQGVSGEISGSTNRVSRFLILLVIILGVAVIALAANQ